VRGDRTISVEVLPRIASVLGVNPEDLAGPHEIDPFLVLALDLPEFRRRLAERGRSEGVTDEATWRYTVATERLPVAARTTGHKDQLRRYIGLIEDFLGGP